MILGFPPLIFESEQERINKIERERQERKKREEKRNEELKNKNISQQKKQ